MRAWSSLLLRVCDAYPVVILEHRLTEVVDRLSQLYKFNDLEHPDFQGEIADLRRRAEKLSKDSAELARDVCDTTLARLWFGSH